MMISHGLSVLPMPAQSSNAETIAELQSRSGGDAQVLFTRMKWVDLLDEAGPGGVAQHGTASKDRAESRGADIVTRFSQAFQCDEDTKIRKYENTLNTAPCA